jgi:hypothetical protein
MGRLRRSALSWSRGRDRQIAKHAVKGLLIGVVVFVPASEVAELLGLCIT